MKAHLRHLLALGLASVVLLVAGAASGSARPANMTAVRVPNVTGLYLNVAERRLLARGLSPVEHGGGFFGIVVKADWQVCFQTPRAGKVVRFGSRVNVYVSRPGNC